jgi:hypothetical protein
VEFGSLSASKSHERLLWSALDQNRVQREQFILAGINRAMEMEAAAATDSRGRQCGDAELTMLQLACPFASSVARFTCVWKAKLARETRASVKWMLAARLQMDPAHTARHEDNQDQMGINWKLVVHRVCDLEDSIEDTASSGQVLVGSGTNSYMFGMCP